MDSQMTSPFIDEIHGFQSLRDFSNFSLQLEALVSAGFLTEVTVDANYGRGEIYGGRWFRRANEDATWRLVPPDFPFRGLWEPIVAARKE